MKLISIRIKDFRSFAGEHDFDASSGVNFFVGPNNCGKSNLMAAVALALDPEVPYVPERDRPAMAGGNSGAPPKTRITLTFTVGSSGPESTLLTRARDYEVAVRKSRGADITPGIRTFADDAQVRLVTTFTTRGERQTTFAAKASGATALSADNDLYVRLESQFRSVTRFAVIHSGEDIATLLKGKFREVLQMVINDHLGAELEQAQAARQRYIQSLRSELLEPLRLQILERVGGLFPEIGVVDLIPDIPVLDETLASVDVLLGDIATTELKGKGTGVRGAVLVSMLHYLAEQSRRSLVLVVEEPEAFLHPAGQEAIMGQLEALATRVDVSLLVTTHSPYVISRKQDALVTELRKSDEGVTERVAAARGDESRAEILGSLYRDPGLARVLERSLKVPSEATAVVVVEGYTDGLFLRQCCEAVGRSELLTGLHIIPAGKAANVVPQAILAEAATDLPVIALLDYDANGKAAVDKLKSFNWEPNKRILSLREWPGACAHHDIEIEDLLPSQAVMKLVTKLGDHAALDGTTKCGDSWHWQLSSAWKDEAIKTLSGHLPKDDSGGMVWLAEEIRRRADKIVVSRARAISLSRPPAQA